MTSGKRNGVNDPKDQRRHCLYGRDITPVKIPCQHIFARRKMKNFILSVFLEY
jgi:hypothetical protein